jgi:hypothetical protein
MLSWVACANCHLSNRRDGTVGVGGPRGPRPPGSLLLNPRVPGAQGSPPVLQRYFVGDSRGTIVSRMFATPWALDDRIEHVKNAGPEELCELANGDPGVFNRPRGSPFYATKITDLQNLRYSRYMDATGTIVFAAPRTSQGMPRSSRARTQCSLGRITSFQMHNAASVSLRGRSAVRDRHLFAVARAAAQSRRGDTRRACPWRTSVLARRLRDLSHVAPHYTNAKLTLAEGWQSPLPIEQTSCRCPLAPIRVCRSGPARAGLLQDSVVVWCVVPATAAA